MTAVKDPLYRAIERRLSERLDPVLFERCAVELLRPVYPGLVPVSGGDDAGMDGAISMPTGGPPVPLVCTTSENVIGNLTKSLESYKRSGQKGREAVLATSQALTPRERRNLEERAQKMGFELLNVHDRHDFTGRLYRHPEWRRELLGLSGDLPALSVYPRLHQPRIRYGGDRALVGRDEAASWVLSQRDDFVLVGQPGVGKRSLLRLLAEKGRGLFVITNDLERIADDYRAAQPEFLLLEDAHLLGRDLHLRSDLLSAICRMRWEIEASFKIAVTTWNWPDRRVANAIGPVESTKTIHPLSRPDTAKIVCSIAPKLPEAAVAEILDQSEGRPGLTVTLAEHAGTRNPASRLHNGQQLLEYLRRSCASPGLTARDLDVLGAFALAGSTGAAFAGVARALGEGEVSVRATLSKIAHTGIVKDRGHYLAIVNPALRAALVARTFFQGPSSLAVCEHLAVMPDRNSATKTLIDALARGVSAPQELIQSRLPEDTTDPADQELWQCYAGTGKAAVRWIVHEHSRKIPTIAYQALRILPATTLPKLISVISASQEDGEPDRQEDTPSSQRSVEVLDSWGIDPAITAIEDWIREPTRHTVRRRRLLLDALSSSFAGLHQASRGLRQATAALVPIVFSLDLRRLRPDLIELGTIWLDIREPLLDHVEQIHALWEPSINLLRKAHAVDTARGIARSWATAPLRPSSGLPPETARVVQDLAAGMITDVVRWSDRRPGVVLWAKQIAAECDLHVAGLPESPSDLKELFGIEPDDLTQGRQDRAIRLVAEKLASRPAAVGIDQLLRYQEEASVMLYKGTALGAVEKVLHHMAELTQDPSACVVVLVSRQAPEHWVAPFVDAMLAKGHGCEEGWRALLDRDEYGPVVLQCVICRSEVPKTVETYVLERLADGRTVLDIVTWRDVPNAWKERVLTHEDQQVAGTAACEMYRQYRDRDRDPELSTLSRRVRAAWRRAVVESDDEATLASVFEHHPNVVKAWLLSPRRHLPANPMLYSTAASVLDSDTKLQLIHEMSASTDPEALIELVGNDATLYDALLSRRDLKQIHLTPLENGVPSPDLTEMAVNHGYSPEDIAKRIASRAESYSMFVDFPEFRTVEEMRNPGEKWFPEPPEAARHRTMAEWERHPSPAVRQIYGLVIEMET